MGGPRLVLCAVLSVELLGAAPVRSQQTTLKTNRILQVSEGNLSESFGANLPIPLNSHGGTGVPLNGKVYIYGGANPDANGNTTSFSDRIFIYDITANAWTENPSHLPYGINAQGSNAAATPSGKIAISPGQGPRSSGGVGQHNRLIIFDPLTGIAQEDATYPVGEIWGCQIVAGGDGSVYSFGGWTGDGVSDIFRYDEDSHSLIRVARLAGGGTQIPDAVLADNGKIYLLGGNQGSGREILINIFDPATNSCALSAARIPFPAEQSGIKVLYFGGDTIYVADTYPGPTTIWRYSISGDRFDSSPLAFSFSSLQASLPFSVKRTPAGRTFLIGGSGTEPSRESQSIITPSSSLAQTFSSQVESRLLQFHDTYLREVTNYADPLAYPKSPDYYFAWTSLVLAVSKDAAFIVTAGHSELTLKLIDHAGDAADLAILAAKEISSTSKGGRVDAATEFASSKGIDAAVAYGEKKLGTGVPGIRTGIAVYGVFQAKERQEAEIYSAIQSQSELLWYAGVAAPEAADIAALIKSVDSPTKRSEYEQVLASMMRKFAEISVYRQMVRDQYSDDLGLAVDKALDDAIPGRQMASSPYTPQYAMVSLVNDYIGGSQTREALDEYLRDEITRRGALNGPLGSSPRIDVESVFRQIRPLLDQADARHAELNRYQIAPKHLPPVRFYVDLMNRIPWSYRVVSSLRLSEIPVTVSPGTIRTPAGGTTVPMFGRTGIMVPDSSKGDVPNGSMKLVFCRSDYIEGESTCDGWTVTIIHGPTGPTGHIVHYNGTASERDWTDSIPLIGLSLDEHSGGLHGHFVQSQFGPGRFDGVITRTIPSPDHPELVAMTGCYCADTSTTFRHEVPVSSGFGLPIPLESGMVEGLRWQFIFDDLKHRWAYGSIELPLVSVSGHAPAHHPLPSRIERDSALLDNLAVCDLPIPSECDLRMDLDDDGTPEYILWILGCPGSRGRGAICIYQGQRPYRYLGGTFLSYEVTGSPEGKLGILPSKIAGYHTLVLGEERSVLLEYDPSRRLYWVRYLESPLPR